MSSRRERLARLLAAAGLDAAVTLRPELIYYLAGVEPYPGLPAALLIRGERALLVWPGDAPDGVATAVETISHDPYASARHRQDGFADVAAAAGERLALRGCRVGLDGAAQPLWLTGDGVEASAVFTDLTRPKSDLETATIAANLEMNDLAFRAVAEHFGAGTSDLEVLDWCCGALARAASGPVGYDGNIGLGSRGDYFDAQPCGIVAAEGDSLFVDLYCRIGHYVGDSTRCFSAGPAPSWLRAAHGRLEEALSQLEGDIRPGAVAGDLDRRCRALVNAETARGVFPHHTGHGVGLRSHEPPYLVPGSRDELQAGDVIAVEPGIYLAGLGGVRLEEVYLVTEDGPRALTGFPRVLTECSANQVS